MNPPATAPAVELRGVNKRYAEGAEERSVLEAVDLVIEPGTIVALLGRSGSGKSTLLNLIAGIDAPTSGSIFVGGRSMTDVSEHERTLFRRRHIGFVFQFFNLIPTLTAAENVSLPLELNGIGGVARRVGELLDAVGLADRGAAFPDRLSGGEQQRVAIARAIAAEPPLVLADEPTGNLDEETGEQVISLLTSIVAARGLTLVVATHSRAVASRADAVLAVRDRTVDLVDRVDLADRAARADLVHTDAPALAIPVAAKPTSTCS